MKSCSSLIFLAFSNDLEIQSVKKILNKRALKEICFLKQITEIRIPFLVWLDASGPKKSVHSRIRVKLAFSKFVIDLETTWIKTQTQGQRLKLLNFFVNSWFSYHSEYLAVKNFFVKFDDFFAKIFSSKSENKL